MNALADKVHKHARSDMHSITWPHYSTTLQQNCSSNYNQSCPLTHNVFIASLRHCVGYILRRPACGQYIASRQLEDAQRRLQFRFKLSTKLPSFRNIFFTIDGCFNCVTSCVKALGWLREELRTCQFWISTASGRPAQNSVLTLLVLLYTEAAYISCFKCFEMLTFCSPAIKSPCKRY